MMKTGTMGEEPWVKDVRLFLSRNPGVLIRLRGLPYECTASQIVDFFRRGDQPSEVADGEDGIYFVRKPDGKSTGDAFVLFRTDCEAQAALTKHKELIGARYIELFRIPASDMEQAVRRTIEAKSRPSAARISAQQLQQPPPQSIIPCGTAKDCIRLRGLPYEAQVQHILDFLGPLAKNIVLQGVHMVYSSLGQPTGEVFVQMDSEASASRAAAQCHNGFMAFGKKQRYVEVFQCSGQDMAAFLSDPAPITSPGMESQLIPQFEPSAFYLPQTAYKSPIFNATGYTPWSTEVSYQPNSSAPKTSTNESLPTVAKPPEIDLLSQPEIYQYPYPPPNPVYLVPRVQPLAYYPKPAYSPVILPQLTPLGMGLLGLKRSWDQAFPMEPQMHASKRWQPGVPISGYYPDV